MHKNQFFRPFSSTLLIFNTAFWVFFVIQSANQENGGFSNKKHVLSSNKFQVY